MWMKGSSASTGTPAKARRTGKPSPSKPDGAAVTPATGGSTAPAAGSGRRGRVRVSAVTAGMASRSSNTCEFNYMPLQLVPAPDCSKVLKMVIRARIALYSPAAGPVSLTNGAKDPPGLRDGDHPGRRARPPAGRRFQRPGLLRAVEPPEDRRPGGLGPH